MRWYRVLWLGPRCSPREDQLLDSITNKIKELTDIDTFTSTSASNASVDKMKSVIELSHILVHSCPKPSGVKIFRMVWYFNKT